MSRLGLDDVDKGAHRTEVANHLVVSRVRLVFVVEGREQRLRFLLVQLD